MITAPVLRRTLPATLTPEDVERLLVAAPRKKDGDTWRAERDEALLETIYASGARVSEAVLLRTDHLEPALRVLRLTGKGSKTRIVPFGRRAQAALDRWMRHGRKLVKHSERSPFVFLTVGGSRDRFTSDWYVCLRAGM